MQDSIDSVKVDVNAPVKKTERSKRITSTIIKALISAALIYWILRGADFKEIFGAIASANYFLVALAFSLHFVGYYLSASRWRILLRTQNVDSKISFLIKSSLVGIFFNNFLPSTIGGDTIRAYDSWRLGKNKANAVSVILIDRFLGLLALLLFAIGAVFFVDQIVSAASFIYLWVGAAAVLALTIIVLIFFPNRKIFVWLNSLSFPLINKISSILEKLGNSIWAFRDKKKELFIALLLSLLLQANVVFYYFLISVALGFGISFYNFFLIIPLSIFVMMLPITINGIGLRENVFFFFLAAFSIAKADAIAFAWIEYGILLLQGVLGGVIYTVRK